MTTSAPRRQIALAVVFLLVGGCSPQPSSLLSDADRRAIADSLKALLVETYDLSKQGPDAVSRFMLLYPDTGRIVSAAAGTFTTSRDSLRTQIEAFWEGAGKFMQRPRWLWKDVVVDVLSRDAAAVSATYSIPHWTPQGTPHVIGGAWTSVWARRDGRWQIVQEHLSDLPVATTNRMEGEVVR